MRKDLLVTGETYHIFSRSIADFRIFNNKKEFERMLQLMKYYRTENGLRFSDFIELKMVQHYGLEDALNIFTQNKNQLIKILAYCLMPTHIHFILKQLTEKGISNYMRKVLNSYTRYFNLKHKRKGPLCESKFKNILIKSDEQLLHLTRYLHLNPTSASIVDEPEDWSFSSYHEYLGKTDMNTLICQFNDVLDITPSSYRKFVNDQVSYQKDLAKIKKLLAE